MVIGVLFVGVLVVIFILGLGVCLKLEVMNLVVIIELLLVVINVQCGGFFIGLFIKFE